MTERSNDGMAIPGALLRERLGRDATAALKEYVITVVDDGLEGALQRTEAQFKELRQENTAIRQDLAVLKQDVAVLKQDVAGLKSDMALFKMELRSDLATSLANQRAELMRWMFTFWVGQAAVTVGLILAIK